MRARLVEQAEMPGDVKSVVQLSGGGWCVVLAKDPEQAIVLDDRFREQHRLHVPAVGDEVLSYAVDPRGRLIAGSCLDGVLAVGTSQFGAVDWRRGHGSWHEFPPGIGACMFSLDGTEVWATVRPVDGDFDEDDEDEDLDEDSGWGDECWVLDAETGRPLARTSLGSEMSYSWLVAHPDGRHIGVVVSEGQDGTFGYWLRREGRRLLKSPTDLLGRSDRAPAAVAPDGSHYLNQSWNELSTHTFPGADLIAERPATELLSHRQPWRFTFGYYDQSTVLATITADSAASTVVFTSPSLEPLGEVEYPGSLTPSAVVPAGDGSWITAHGSEIARWRLEESQS